MGPLYEALLARVKALGPVGVCLVEALDEEALSAVSMAEKQGFVAPYLIGARERIQEALERKGISLTSPVLVDAKDPAESAKKGIGLIRDRAASILMKGKLATSLLLRAALDREEGLRTGRILSHVACLEVEGYDRFIFVTDGGVVMNPDLEKKIEIVKNAIGVAKVMGVSAPRIACLGPSELPSLDSEASIHGAILSKMAHRGVFPGAFVDGPMALDVAVSPESARIKGVFGEVAGKADVLLAPDLVSGNSLAKSIQYFARAIMGGVIVGAAAPIVLISRSDTSLVKLNSLAMARCLVG